MHCCVLCYDDIGLERVNIQYIVVSYLMMTLVWKGLMFNALFCCSGDPVFV